MRDRHGVAVEVLSADLLEPDALSRIEERLQVGDVAVLVNNAGFGLDLAFEENDVDAEVRHCDCTWKPPCGSRTQR